MEDFKRNVTAVEKAEFRSWFGTRKIFNRQPSKPHVLSVSLFWKHVGENDPDLCRPTRYRFLNARRLGLVKRLDPWHEYVEPLLLHSKEFSRNNPDVCMRLYLAGDLSFLVSDFVALGWEVHLMRSSSIRYCPGGFWRFLALEEPGRWVTVVDADRMKDASNDVSRTRLIQASDLGLWRVPGYYNDDNKTNVRYRPLLGGHFGAKGGIKIKTLVRAFSWHLLRDTLPVEVNFADCSPRPLHYLNWPGYGVDEVFLLMALYPRVARRGVLSFVPTDARSLILPVDIEYATWANPRSEVVYFSAGGCC